MLGRASRFVWDVRALWADQRIATGALREGSLQVKAVRALERAAATRAAAAIVLTRAVVEPLQARHGSSFATKAHVIPTCVDLGLFEERELPAGPIGFLISGSINRFYDVEWMVRFVGEYGRTRPSRLAVLSQGPTPWDDHFARANATRSSARPDDVPSHVAASHVGLCVCDPRMGISLKGAMPTKIAEFLAGGRPVIVNAGLGDMDGIIEEFGCGVVVDDPSDTAMGRIGAELDELLARDDITSRCRNAAKKYFDLDDAVGRLATIYRECYSS
jgi:glycosyltransferase involved in cell wall biosynthesis